MARTQKARGLEALRHAGIPVPLYSVVQEKSQIENALSLLRVWHSEAFVRPCPARPRHGFVESRRVPLYPIEESERITAELFDEALAHDPLAELLIMPYIPAVYNVITTPGLVAVGEGHDGATAGKNVVSLPWLGFVPDTSLTRHLDDALRDAEITDTPYFEWLVPPTAMEADLSSIVAVQLRDGPRLPSMRDFVPQPMTVRRVIRVDKPDALDLLEWERLVASLRPGEDVVYLAGASLASHAAVHCVARNIAVMTSREPGIGETLEPCTETGYEKQAFAEGLQDGMAVVLGDSLALSARALRFALFAVHNAAVMRGADSYWLGVAASTLLRLGLAVILGELRHNQAGAAVLKQKFAVTCRDSVYEYALMSQETFRRSVALVEFAKELFLNGNWPYGYGGQAWYRCTLTWQRLYRAVQAAQRRPGELTIGLVISAANAVIHNAHNNGWWFNKFVDPREFDYAAVNHPQFAAAAAVFAHELAEAKRASSDGPARGQG